MYSHNTNSQFKYIIKQNKYPRNYNIRFIHLKKYTKIELNMKILIIYLCLFCLIGYVNGDQSQAMVQSVPPTQVLMSVGQIYPGQINIAQNKQAFHYLKIDSLQKKYLFLRVNTYDKVKLAIGLYLNQTRTIVHACQKNMLDSCFVSTQLLKPNTVYIVLIVVDDNIKYNLFTYWADLEHIKPNQEIKFMFDNTNPSQLFHLEFDQNQQFQQIRMILKPQTTRTQGDNLRIFANIGFNSAPTAQQHQYESIYVWNDAQAIILSKQQINNETGIGIYIVGNAQTVYIFQCQFIKQKSHNIMIGQIINDYLPRQKQTSYRFNFAYNINIDSFVIKISTFSGQIMLQFYYDKQLTKLVQKSAYQYMSDQQFNFDQQDFAKNTTQIYMKLKSMDAVATYQITSQARNKQLAYQITQNVYQFTQMTLPKQALYFYSHIWNSNQFQATRNYKFDISIIRISGNPKINYYYCKPQSQQKQCTNVASSTFEQHVQSINPFGVEEIGTKQIITLSLDQSAYKSINNVEKMLMIIIVVMKTVPQPIAWALQYSNPNQIRLLRQGRAFQDKVRNLQKRYYKYVNNNPQVSQIRIHANEISGLTKIRAKRSAIFQKDGPVSTLDNKYPDTIIIKDHITDPIYLQVYGVVTSLYTLTVSAIHSQHLVSNALIMAEDIQYQVKLLPYQHMNIQLHPIQSKIVFQYYTQGGSVMICQVDAKDLCINQKVFGSHGEIQLDTSHSRQMRLRIGNYVQSKQSQSTDKKTQHLPQVINNVKLTLIYHGERFNHCDQRRINKVYSENIKKGSCYKFHLPIEADLEIMAIRSDLGQTTHIFVLCSNKIVPSLINQRYIIKSYIIQQNCKNSANQMILQMVISDTSIQEAQEVKMDYSVEYLNDTITLADGVAYWATGYSNSQAALRTFFYQIIDQNRDVDILMYNKKGHQKFFVKIINKPQRYVFVTQVDSRFSSKDSNYYANPHVNINSKAIAQANCGRTCVLVISVYSTQKAGTQLQYAMQVTQNHLYLKQDQIKTDFLPKGSTRFYQYQSKTAAETLFFIVSDNNRKCAKNFLSKTPFPSNSNYIAKQNEGTLIYEKVTTGTFYFAIQATEDCPYTISVSQGKAKVTKIQYGQYFDIKLEQGQVKWFYARHNTNSTFKLITLKKFGNLKIYANQTDLSKQALANIQGKKIDLNKFAFKSSYQNTLAIDSAAKQYCFNCYYFICLEASKKTQASIFLGGQASKIALSQDKILFDTIQNKNSVTLANFYRVSNGRLQVKVHSGKINLQMSYSNQKFSKSYEKNRKVYQQIYNFTRQQGIWTPLQIRITAQIAPALYSIELSPQKDQQLYQRKLNTGEHTYIYLSQGKQECFIGTITKHDQQIFISTDVSQKFVLSNLKFNVMLQDNVTENYEKQIVGNILSIRFKPDSVIMPHPKKYKVCISTQSSKTALALYVFQNVNINLIHSDTQILVRKQSRFVLYPHHDIILDLFECKGIAQIYYGSNLQKIRQKQSRKLDTIGIPGQSHAIKISEFSTIYVNVIAEMATVLWMPLIQKQQRGIGYFKYAIGSLEFYSNFNIIQFKVGGVYKLKQTATKPLQVKYTIYVTNSKQLLQQAVMCQKTPKNKLVSATVTKKSVGSSSKQTITVQMDKKRITDEFSTNQTLYFNVVADMTLQPPNNKDQQDHQHYRFIYFQQVVPSEVFRQNQLQSMQIHLLIVLAIVSIIGLILIGCIFVKCIVPALGKLKNRVLVQEKQDPKDQSIPVPPSSDRNQIGTVPSGTEDGIK